MSREFRFVERNYFHRALEEAGDEQGGRHEVTKLLTDLYGALAPLETDSASYEASDSGQDRVVLGLQKQWPKIEEVMLKLKGVYLRDHDLITSLLRQHAGKIS